MMRISLFWKMLVGFLLAFFLPLSIFEVYFALRRSPGEANGPPEVRRMLTWMASSTASEMRPLLVEGKNGEIGARLAQIREESGVYLALFGSGDRWPTPLEEKAFSSPEPPRMEVVLPFVVGEVRYRMVARILPFGGGFPQRDPLLLLVPLLVGALLSSVLVRHIARPVFLLRSATLRIAEGDFGARAGSEVIDRRDEISDLGKAFDGMAERIEGLMTSQRRMLGDISHELRSPLQRLDVALTLGRSGCSSEAQSYIDRAALEATRINDLVGQVLLIAEADLSPSGARLDAVDMAALLTRVAEDARFEGRSSVRDVALTLREPLSSVAGEEALLGSAVENVVRNALRHAPEGSTVEITAWEEEGSLVVMVRDHGEGIAEEELQRIFLPFYRVDAARDRKRGGAGLGLAISERVVRKHGGRIEARNAPGGGLLMEMVFPVRSLP